MTKTFIEKILKDRSVDTAKYRYAVKDVCGKLEIRRLPLERLDTTAALTEWETVWCSDEA